MKPVFKCDYCSEMGTEDEIREHEIVCTDNYDRKSCFTCSHKKMNFEGSEYFYICRAGKAIPKGKLFEFCESYERKEKSKNPLGDLFSSLFGA